MGQQKHLRLNEDALLKDVKLCGHNETNATIFVDFLSLKVPTSWAWNVGPPRPLQQKT